MENTRSPFVSTGDGRLHVPPREAEKTMVGVVNYKVKGETITKSDIIAAVQDIPATAYIDHIEIENRLPDGGGEPETMITVKFEQRSGTIPSNGTAVRGDTDD